MPRTRPARRLPNAWILTPLIFAGCATLGEQQGQPLVPTRYQTRTGPYAVSSNFPIARDAPAIRSLQSLEKDVEASLGIRIEGDAAPIEVYILNDRQSFAHFLKFYYPELPPRRAFFLAQGTQRVVFTFMGDRLEEDLRHEATHALLHVAYGDLPIWLDEGLAEYFEGSDGRQGLNPEHLGRLPQDLAAGWKPDLARLETLQTVRQMAPRDYRESWAWVHYLLNGPPAGKATLLAYMGDAQKGPDAVPLSARLKPKDGGAPGDLLAHIDRVRNAPVAAKTEATVRMQDNAIELARTPPARRGFFVRVRGLFGL